MVNTISVLIFMFFIDGILCKTLEERCVYIDYSGKDLNVSKIGCPKTDICQKNFSLSFIQMPPYSGFPIGDILKKCCGSCARFVEKNKFADITEITTSSMDSSDFILPFLGNTSANSLYGYSYIPIVTAPNVFYVTRKHKPALVRLVSACLQFFPLIIICITMAVISGFIAWIMEIWLNKVEFPRSFVTGWFQGFWWSFITMTTVGYGDKTPKSFATRLFCICWIIIGIATFSLLTALLTGELLKANSPDPPEMMGANVGVLKYRDYDRYMIAKQGGIVTETKGWDFFSDVFFLIGELSDGTIDGFVLDKYTLSLASTLLMSLLNNKQYESFKTKIEFFIDGTLRTEKVIVGESFSYGILVKNVDVYGSFFHAVLDNRIQFETRLALKLNKKRTAKVEINIFSPTDPYFQDSIKVMASMIGAICLFGMIYEGNRRKVYIHLLLQQYGCIKPSHAQIATPDGPSDKFCAKV